MWGQSDWDTFQARPPQIDSRSLPSSRLAISRCDRASIILSAFFGICLFIFIYFFHLYIRRVHNTIFWISYSERHTRTHPHIHFQLTSLTRRQTSCTDTHARTHAPSVSICVAVNECWWLTDGVRRRVSVCECDCFWSVSVAVFGVCVLVCVCYATPARTLPCTWATHTHP